MKLTQIILTQIILLIEKNFVIAATAFSAGACVEWQFYCLNRLIIVYMET